MDINGEGKNPRSSPIFWGNQQKTGEPQDSRRLEARWAKVFLEMTKGEGRARKSEAKERRNSRPSQGPPVLMVHLPLT